MELELEKQKKETEKSQIREKKAEMARLEVSVITSYDPIRTSINSEFLISW